MKTCDTCKHWSKKTVGEEDDLPKTAYDPNRRCSFLNDQESDVLPMCLGYIGMVDITTAPKFGCIHHAPKKPCDNES